MCLSVEPGDHTGSIESKSGSSRNFIQQIIDDDLKEGRVKGEIITRFPPEPNGYLHIGHAVRAVWINFAIAEEYGGRCHLRFDDTNPETEDMEYVHAIEEDVQWLGFDWGEHRYFASDYFEQLYGFAVKLIEDGNAYVDSLSEAEIREFRGTVTKPGRESPYRSRSPEENLSLFENMRVGEYPDGSHVLRAKIDMASPNMLMRDPVLYRIKHASHYRRGNDFPIYPLYDFAHPLSDAIENITHSLCSLEFEVHRALYDWLVNAVREPPHPHQYEFARFNIDYTILSKRKLLQLVEEGLVSGWDDPRMPTVAGLRRRGVTPESLRNLADMIGIAKSDTRVDISMLEYAIRDDLNTRAPRVMCVLRPLRVVLTNFPEEKIEWTDASYWPHDIAKEGTRPVPLTREIYIERDDFMEDPPKKFHRLSPGSEVRLRYGYIIRCDKVIKDEAGNVVELQCTYDPDTQSGSGSSSRSVKGTIHWVSATEAYPIQVRLYDRLFAVPNPDEVEEGQSFKDHLNPGSLETLDGCVVEPSVKSAAPGDRFQFERQGYFFVDPIDSSEGHPVFNRTITLRDTWGKRRASAPQIKSEKTDPQSDKRPAGAVKIKNPLAGLNKQAILRAEQLVEKHALSLDDAALLASEQEWHSYFESAALRAEAVGGEATAVANWLIHEMRPALGDSSPTDSKVKPGQVATLVNLMSAGTISSRIAKNVFEEMLLSGADPEHIIEERGLNQISDPSAIEEIVTAVLAEFPERAQAYRNGKTGLIGFFVGQVMSRSSGKANPLLVKEILARLLG